MTEPEGVHGYLSRRVDNGSSPDLEHPPWVKQGLGGLGKESGLGYQLLLYNMGMMMRTIDIPPHYSWKDYDSS